MAEDLADSALFESVQLKSLYDASDRNRLPMVIPDSATDCSAICAVCVKPVQIWRGPALPWCGHIICVDCLNTPQTDVSFLRCRVCGALCDFQELGRGYRNGLDHVSSLEADARDLETENGQVPAHSSVHLALAEGTDQRKFFVYDAPLPEETGAWIPVSVPPTGGYSEIVSYGGDFFPDDSTLQGHGSSAPEFTHWSILIEVIATLCGGRKSKGRSKSSTGRVYEALDFTEDWDDSLDPLAQAFTDQMEDHVRSMATVLASEPPQWLPDSSASSCMQCHARFHPITCSRHHCRFCGGIFCGGCTAGRSLLPVKFRERRPQRVCDCCFDRLGPVQGILLEQVSNAAQLATHDVTDRSCMRAWINSPLGLTLEHEIYKATNTLRSFSEVGTLKPERSIPDVVLKGAKGLAIFTMLRAGMMVTYKVGSGLVVVKREDGTWSAPSAIVACGMGWGLQVGGEVTDFIVVLRNQGAIKAFGGRAHLSLGAGVSVAAGPVGRTVEADLRAGNGGAAACYSYSLSKGAFIGCSLEGDFISTRMGANVQFYGDPYINPTEILFGSVKQPKAAAPLYDALADLFRNVYA